LFSKHVREETKQLINKCEKQTNIREILSLIPNRLFDFFTCLFDEGEKEQKILAVVSIFLKSVNAKYVSNFAEKTTTFLFQVYVIT